jgi:serine/threonine protein kinase
MTPSEARKLYKKLSFVVTTQAANNFICKNGYFFDGLIVPPSSQSKTILQFVVKNCILYCAKIGDKRNISYENEIMLKVHANFERCPTVLRCIDSFDVRDEQTCVIVPFYPKSIAEFGLNDSIIVPDDIVINMSICVLSAIKALSTLGLCHGDIKPSNIMVDNSSDVNVLIDFGACVELGGLCRESSLFYALDVVD